MEVYQMKYIKLVIDFKNKIFCCCWEEGFYESTLLAEI